jgi:hypothetical protein
MEVIKKPWVIERQAIIFSVTWLMFCEKEVFCMHRTMTWPWSHLLDPCLHLESIPMNDLVVSSRIGHRNVLDSIRFDDVKGWREASQRSRHRTIYGLRTKAPTILVPLTHPQCSARYKQEKATPFHRVRPPDYVRLIESAQPLISAAF